MKWTMRLSLETMIRLSAIVAKIVGADLLIMLSDIDGLLIRTQMFMRMRPFVAMSQRLPRKFWPQLVVLVVNLVRVV